MDTKKNHKNITFGLISLCLFMLFGLGICHYIQVRNVPHSENPETTANNKSKENAASGEGESVKKKAGLNSHSLRIGEDAGTRDLDELKNILDTLEKELDMVYNRMTDESRKIELVRRQVRIDKKRLEDPDTRKILREVRKDTLIYQYGPLLSKLNLPPDQREKLMEILLDEQMASLQIGTVEIDDPDEGKKIVSAIGHRDIGNEYQVKIGELLDYDAFREYQIFKENLKEAY